MNQDSTDEASDAGQEQDGHYLTVALVPRGGNADYRHCLTREVRPNGGDGKLPRIFAFINGGSADWWNMAALSEDGEFLAGHVCSHPIYGPHDMGIDGNWKHDAYLERYPNGFELVWYPGNPKKNDDEIAKAINVAHEKHMAAGEEGTAWQRERNAQAQPTEHP